MGKNESHPDARDTADQTGRRHKTVVVRMPQGYSANVDIRIVAGEEIPFRPLRFCQPRQGAPRRTTDPHILPDSLVDKLRDAGKQILDDLARDKGLAKHFLVDPIETLIRAKIELTPAEEKMLRRAHRATTEGSILTTGVQIASLSVSVDGKGVTGPRPWPRLKDEPSKDCGPTPEGEA